MDEQMGGERRMRMMPPELIIRIGAVTLGLLALFLLAQTFKTFKEYRYIGSGVTASNTISVSGTGEVFAVPDRATFTVTIREEAPTVAVAQDEATEKANDIIAYLKSAGVEENDIKTVNYNVNPKYEYTRVVCTEFSCPPSNQRLVGFEVWQMIEVKVQDPQKAGELLTGVGSRGASEVSSLSFTIEDEDELQAQARQMAIDEAREKAQALAQQLGVSIVRVVGFSEDSYGYPPMPYYARGGAVALDAVAMESKVAPELPTGENKITSNVHVTYEIR
ncbi:MAG TPA: SIMPL domain-containing protein [Candidatus Paceibacterota bacterium]|nr:SIMPL domain-containing protein [Candidatus Paceibacterota bacterium]